MNKEKIFLLCLTPKERMIWEKKAYTTEEYNELTKKKIFYNRVIEETAKTILEEVEKFLVLQTKEGTCEEYLKHEWDNFKKQFEVK